MTTTFVEAVKVNKNVVKWTIGQSTVVSPMTIVDYSVLFVMHFPDCMVSFRRL